MSVVTFVSLALGTLVSEDLACITAGLLIRRGEIGMAAGVLACASGIFLGDVGLWAIGRLGGRASLRWPWIARRVDHRHVEALRMWIEAHAAAAIVASRFLPGTRLPLYVIAGFMELPGRVFATWALVGAMLWTPVIVLLSAGVDAAFVRGMPFGPDARWLAHVLAACVVVLLLHGGRVLASASHRARLIARLHRWSRWEFWPMWLFYAPVAAWVAWLALRHRGLATVTTANPGMQDGGTVGESKFDILSRLPAEAIVPTVLIRPGSPAARMAEAEEYIRHRDWRFPLVTKPDVGQRGAGVKLARTSEDLLAYLSREAGPVIVQPYHPGPFEAGVFYYRMPGEARGRLLSVTDKHFPFLVGDGRSTIEELIWTHPRYRLQAGVFMVRHAGALGRVLDAGERFQLAIAGNHAQGTLFRDGAHLMTPALERRIDDISRAFPGFHVGRFDIRYADVDAFKAGRDLAIVELNGATGESTSIYDPGTPVLAAYRQLFRQWSIVFAIGAANRRSGAPPSSNRRLLELLRVHLTSRVMFPVSD